MSYSFYGGEQGLSFKLIGRFATVEEGKQNSLEGEYFLVEGVSSNGKTSNIIYRRTLYGADKAGNIDSIIGASGNDGKNGSKAYDFEIVEPSFFNAQHTVYTDTTITTTKSSSENRCLIYKYQQPLNVDSQLFYYIYAGDIYDGKTVFGKDEESAHADTLPIGGVWFVTTE